MFLYDILFIMSFLDKVKNTFGKIKLGAARVDSVIGLDIGSSSVKVVQLKRHGGKAILETYGELATGPYDNRAIGQAANLSPEAISRLLADLFREANVTAKNAAISIPLRSSLLKTIELPEVPTAQMANIIPIEARKYIPVPIGEVTLDWSILPKQAMREAEVAETASGVKSVAKPTVEALIVAIHNDILSQYTDISNRALLETKFFEIETFSAIRAVFTGELAPVVIVDIGAGSTKVAVIDYGVVRMSHTINKGSQDISVAISRSLNVDFAKAEEIKRRIGLIEHIEGTEVSSTISSIVEYVFAEVNRVLVDYQRKEKRAVSKVVLIGSGALLRGVGDIAKKTFSVPVVMGNGFSKVETPAFLTEMLSEVGPAFAVSTGLALRHLQEL